MSPTVRAVVGAVDEQLDQTVVLQDGHAGFPLAPVDQDLALQVCLSPAGAGQRGRRRCPLQEAVPASSERAARGQPDANDVSPGGGARLAPIICRAEFRATQSTSSPRICRAMTIRWISLVPSPISQTLASRIMRSTGYSVV